ncbi:MAG TPA: hypothetical protein VFJ58_04570 [Armatimonadota bacterium]|nr:hypothetical protein [Armatimonadota bacterium]
MSTDDGTPNEKYLLGLVEIYGAILRDTLDIFDYCLSGRVPIAQIRGLKERISVYVPTFLATPGRLESRSDAPGNAEFDALDLLCEMAKYDPRLRAALTSIVMKAAQDVSAAVKDFESAGDGE